MSLLQTHKLTKSFGGVHAVDQVDVSFEAGKITALVGPNGSGKTTLINAITGLLPMESGEIIVSLPATTAAQAGDSVRLQRIVPSEIASYGITRTFQNVRLVGQMSVLDNVLLVLTERNVFGALFERHGKLHLDAAEDILKKVGLWEKRHQNAEHLSYGQRKLLEIARAVSTRSTGPGQVPQIYFFDEPFAGLFPEMSKTVSEVLRDLRSRKAAIILVEHDMALIRDLSDYCYVLDSGKVIAEGTPEKVLALPHVIEAYLGK